MVPSVCDTLWRLERLPARKRPQTPTSECRSAHNPQERGGGGLPAACEDRLAAGAAFSASMILDCSPPDATAPSDRRGSAGPAASRYSTLSRPSAWR